MSRSALSDLLSLLDGRVGDNCDEGNRKDEQFRMRKKRQVEQEAISTN